MNDRLYRSVDDRVIAGVCSGLAVRFALDPSLVRILWVVVAIVTGVFPLLVLYVIIAAVVPEEPGGFAGVGPSPTPPDGAAGPVDATITGGPAPATPPPTWYQGSPGAGPGRRERRDGDPLPAAIGGLVLVALGVYFLVRDRIAVDWGVVGAAGLIALGAVVILAALRPRR
ncbi:MAG TPA: PspC domain-containing protein [Candidatus Nanopelagicales bacterium]|nr:PspC domain-containing protein [Candidatus Nanopelagicales bacterium]